MGKIKQLPLYEAQKIAAGEVVERPANVLKELLENALDAHATQISVFIEEGGKKLIKVVDNGSGMSQEDAYMCIKHHATSKISSVNDLSTITTFGFRGEALSSIVSVSHLTITTKRHEDQTGIELIILDNLIQKEKIVSCNTGTTISVANIFYNIPARQKFLKATTTEWRSINQLFHAFCLDYTHVYFKLYHHDKLVIHCPATDNLQTRIAQLYDPSFAQHTLAINAQGNNLNLKLRGAITNTHHYRFDRNQIFLFVNHRWVKNYKLSQALVKGYQGVLQPKKYPVAFLFITLDTESVDINIHPQKEEVQFLHPRLVESFIEDTIKERLELYHTEQIAAPSIKKKESLAISSHFAADTTSPTLNNKNISFSEFEFTHHKTDINTNNNNSFILPAQESTIHESQTHALSKSSQEDTFLNILDTYFKGATFKDSTLQSSKSKEAGSYIEEQKLNLQTYKQPSALDLNTLEPTIKSLHDSQSESLTSLESQKFNLIQAQIPNPSQASSFEYKIIGQLFTTYIIIEAHEGLLLIDQHAAHERIIYENLRSQFNQIPTIKLLFATTISVTQQDMSLFNEYSHVLEKAGIIAEQMGPNQIIITEAPAIFKNQSLEKVVKQFIAWIYDSQKVDANSMNKLITEKLHAEMSCKAAVKAGDTLTSKAMKEVIDTLYSTENKLTCPHGRPTLWTIGKYEIEKKFKRDYR